jgi:hypothetical protein
MKLLRTAACLIATVALVLGLAPTAAAQTSMTWTLEPFDFDGYFGYGTNLTQTDLGGTKCPCTKVPYISDGLNNQGGADNINKLALKGAIKSGDTVMGFSLGSQVVALYLSQHTPPPGVRFILLAWTFQRNAQLVAVHQGVPADTPNEVTYLANEYDGWGDFPDAPNPPWVATNNSDAGKGRIHDYRFARLDNPGNVVTKQGNITELLVPTQKLPGNDWLRDWGMGSTADSLDAQQRASVDVGYARTVPTAAQLAAAAAEQVPVPPPAVQQQPEPVATP